MDKKTMEKVINGMAEKIEKLEKINLLNADRNIKNMEHFEFIGELLENIGARVDGLVDWKIKLNDMDRILLERCDVLEDNIKTLNNKISGLQWDTAQDTDENLNWLSNINDKCDELEAKNYQIKSDLDKLITCKNIEALSNGEETITLGELRKFKDWSELNEAIKEGHETIKRVKANKGVNNG